MSSDKMREEFEAWANSLFYPLDSYESGLYVKLLVQDMWAAWQASRAAVVVELPQQSGVNLDWNQAIRYCHQAIEASGLKVKQ